MEDSDCSVSLSNLICQEDGSTLLLGDGDEEEKSDMVTVYNDCCIFSETEEDDYIDMLFSKESVRSDSRGSGVYDDSSEDWLKCARSDAVRWILKTKACFGFCSKTAYMAVTYLDRFLMHRRIDDKGKIWAVQLLSVACLSLAAKMEECKVPALSEFRYDFKSNLIQRMEFLVLNTLEWRLNSVTPFAYLSYFASRLQEHKWSNLMARAIGFIFAATGVMNLVDHRPSVIAAAATLAAFDERLTQNLAEFKKRTISLRGSLETEHVFSCYCLMIQESHKEKLKPSKNLIATTSFTARSSKRRRSESPHAE
ncbi:cyclin-D5-1-like isoform X1 [Phoenix dactylifera]|uniref:Cyclin-D5-1-like isoform X1 n=1 Tax=Phoenix dactylifera TaxID=42345 RepID=A0A8B8ZNE7_PHODC|nr:cyclin-D5-1-like isoform X1 [Phoenix dactylifera]